MLKFFIRIAVIQYFHLIRQTAGETSVLKPGFSFIGFVDKGRADAQKRHILAAQIGKLLCGELSAREIITGNTWNLRSHRAVNGDEGSGFFYDKIGIVGQTDDAVYFIMLCHRDIFLFLLMVEVGGTQQHPVLSLHKRNVYMISQRRIERVEGVRDQKRDRVGLTCLQALCVAVDLII